MKRLQIFSACVIGLTVGTAAYAQFGGILDKAKGKIDKVTNAPKSKVDEANSKAKPVTDRAQKAAGLASWSDAEEQEIGEASAAKMIAMFGLLDSPKVQKYVNLVGSSVAQYAPRQVPYRFAVLNSDLVGAFAIPGGYIFITRAAMDGMKSEAELAGALGHEIIHVSERHLESEVHGKNTSKWALEEAQTQTNRAPDIIRQRRVDALVKDLFDMRLSRDKEEGADERGSILAAQAGYAPGGLLAFLRTLAAQESRPEAKRAMGQLLSTHPSFADRIGVLEAYVAKTGNSGKTLEDRFTKSVE